MPLLKATLTVEHDAGDATPVRTTVTIPLDESGRVRIVPTPAVPKDVEQQTLIMLLIAWPVYEQLLMALVPVDRQSIENIRAEAVRRFGPAAERLS